MKRHHSCRLRKKSWKIMLLISPLLKNSHIMHRTPDAHWQWICVCVCVCTHMHAHVCVYVACSFLEEYSIVSKVFSPTSPYCFLTFYKNFITVYIFKPIIKGEIPTLNYLLGIFCLIPEDGFYLGK